MIEDTDGQNPEAIADNFGSLFDRAYTIEKLSLDVDVSMGIAFYSKDATDTEGLLQCADVALYSCKDEHYPYAVYKPELNKHSVQRLSLMSELRGHWRKASCNFFINPNW